MDKSHDISVLNGLIKTTLDSMKGYSDACEDSESAHASHFRQMADERSKVASQLQAQVASLGGEPQDDSSITAAAHRGIMDLKQAVMGKDEKAIVQEVERGEDFIKEKYEAALKDDDLSPESKQVVQQCYQSVQQGHAQASQMKHQMEA